MIVRFPPQGVQPDRTHPLGKYLRSWIVPGWAGAVSNTTGDIPVWNNGRLKKYLSAASAGTGGDSITKIVERYRTGGAVPTVEVDQAAYTDNYYFVNTDADYGSMPPGLQPFTVVAIHKPIGDGTVDGNTDPRVYSKDSGFHSDEHDLMLGYIGGVTYTHFRMRVRWDGITTTCVSTESATKAIENNAWNLIAGTWEPGGTGTATAQVYHFNDANGFQAGGAQVRTTGTGYDPRTSTYEGLYNTVGTPGTEDRNPYQGSIACVLFFEGIEIQEELDYRSLFDNPWQVFQPQRIIVPTFPYVPTDAPAPAPSNVVITDVANSGETPGSGSETWDDGSSGNVITGTGFL